MEDTKIAKPEWEIDWIDRTSQLEELSETLADLDLISVDTETIGWQSGNEKLCLIQIGLPLTKRVAVIDALALEDLSPLSKSLSAQTPIIVAHNASFEARQFDRHKIKLGGVADTLEMARRLRSDLPNHTLKTCCRYILDLTISKEEQVSDWGARPLTPSQLSYAALDAEITLKLYYVLAEMQAQLEIDPEVHVPELMALYSSTVSERLALTKEIAPMLSLLNARESLIKESIRAKLIAGDPAYEGPLGKCNVIRVKKTEINPQMVREKLPEIADKVVGEYVEKKRLVAVMKEYGISEKLIEEVTDVVGYNDRLNLTLGDL